MPLGKTRRVGLDLATESRRVALVGPSGAGKSSLVRAIALGGLGEVVVDGWVAERPGRVVPAWERGFGWSPQDPLLPPHLTVRELIGWGRPPEVGEIAEGLRLGPVLDRRPRHLSGGERQRVAVGRALGAGRRLLLLDEPFSALDTPLRREVARFVDAWAAARNLPLILVSHDSGDWSTLVDLSVEVGPPTGR